MDYEVLVVGGGPAGCSSSYFLSKNGVETCIVERDIHYKKPCGGGIPSAGLKDLELLDEIEKKLKFNRVKKIKIVPPLSEFLEIELKGGEILVFDRLELDSFLRNLAINSGANLIEGELISLEQNDKIQASIRTKNGELKRLRVKYLIAADGVNSRVCSLTGMNKPDFTWTVSLQIPLSEKNLNEQNNMCEFWFGSSHASSFYSWVFPGNGYLSVGTGATRADLLKSLLLNFIKKRFSEPLDIENVKIRAFKIPKWKKREFCKGNIILCGDALGTVMPVSFEGIYYAMKSGQFAAQAIKERNLALYEKLWNSRFGKQFFIMRKFQDFMFADDEKMDRWLNIHRTPQVQELAMALWLRKQTNKELIYTYIKAFGSIISRIAFNRVKINM